MTKRGTKHSLLMSVLALLVCASMLVGTTFAWFTDSVTSAGNIIKSGTLDVSLEWLDSKTDPTTAADTAWKDASLGAIFNYSLWEPGYTEVRHIKIENEGTLALKYNLTITAYDENGNALAPENAGKLAKVIDVYYIDPAKNVDERTDFDSSNYLGTLDNVLSNLSTSANGTLKADEYDTITLALKMQESAGNEYQNESIGASFAVTLFATQLTSEKDSFDEKYDEDADYPVTNSAYIAEGTSKTLGDGNVFVTVPTATSATAGTYTLEVSNESKATDTSGNTTVSYDIALYKDGAKVEAAAGVNYTVKINVGTLLNVTGITHNGAAITPFDYDPLSGLVTFTTDSFSPFAVTYKEVEGVYVLESGEYTLGDDITLDEGETVTIPEDAVVVINMDGQKIDGGFQTGSTTKHVYAIENKGTLTLDGEGDVNGRGVANYGTLTVNGGTYNAIDANGGASIWNYAGSSVEVNGGTFVTADTPVAPGPTCISIAAGASAVINGGTFTGDANQTYAVINNGTLTINNAEITSDHGVISNSGTLTLNGGTFTQNGNLPQTSSLIYTYGGTAVINGGTYKFNVGGKLDSGLPVYFAAGSVEINGGVFTGYVTEMLSSWGGTGTASVKGGTFDKAPGFVADGYYEIQNADGTYTVVLGTPISSDIATTPAEVAKEITKITEDGGNVIFTEDVEAAASTTAPYGNKVGIIQNGGVIDGNGNKLDIECYGDDYGIMTSGGTIKNITIEEGCRAVMLMYAKENVVLDNVNIGGDGVLYPINTGEYGDTSITLTVTNSTLAGWTSYAGIASASFTNVKFEQGTYYDGIYGRVLKPYVNTTLTDCSFVASMNLDLSSLTNGHKVVLDNCRVNGEAITIDTLKIPASDADYDTLLFTVDLPSWASDISDCIEVK